MTEQAFADKMATEGQSFDAMDPANIAPTVVWLGSGESAHVTGCVFELEGGKIMLEDGWREGPMVDAGAKWEPGGRRRSGGKAARRTGAAAQSVGYRLMDFAFTDEQAMIGETARAFFAENATSERTRKAMAADGIDRALWQSFCTELGLSGIALPEGHGGAGLGMVEFALVAEAAGAPVAALPLLGSIAMAASAIAAGGSDVTKSAMVAATGERQCDRRLRGHA